MPLLFDEFGSFGLLVLQLGLDEVNTAVQACHIEVDLHVGIHIHGFNQTAAEVVDGDVADGFAAANGQLSGCRVRINNDVGGSDNQL